MKKLGLLFAILGSSCLIGFGTIKSSPVMVRAEGEETLVEDLSATVALPKLQHGTVEASLLEGQEGDICKLNIKPEMFYLINSVTVNGTALVEDENISGLYSFALVRGENVVAIKIVVNQELLGELSSIYEQAQNKDWTNLFTVENIIHLIKWVLDCGVLVAIVRYFIRDKRLADKLEKSLKAEMDKILPESTKQTVLATVESVLAPTFAQLKADNIELSRAMGIFAKCLALMQQDTPESRIAILDMLSNLNISDEKTLAEIKAYIEKLFADHANTYNEIMDKLNAISEENKEIAEVKEEETEAEKVEEEPDGTSI